VCFDARRDEASVNDDYSSHSKKRLSVDATSQMLLDLDIVQRVLTGESIIA
jgi:hypothetical protein